MRAKSFLKLDVADTRAVEVGRRGHPRRHDAVICGNVGMWESLLLLSGGRSAPLRELTVEFFFFRGCSFLCSFFEAFPQHPVGL